MKKSIKTYLKRPSKDNTNRSANPSVTRASTILFDTMQELKKHELKIKQNKKITHYSYGRYGSSTTIELENILKELENAYHVFLTGTGFGGIALALMSLCRPGDEILVSDNVYGPTKEISEKLLKEFNVTAKFYNPESFEDLNDFITRFPESEYAGNAKQRMIYLRNLIAKQEIYVAEFYIERKAFVAALARADYVLKYMPKTPQVERALEIMIISYQELGQDTLKADVEKALQTFKQNSNPG